MQLKRQIGTAPLGERLRPAMSGAFPPVSGIPAAMRAVLAELECSLQQHRAIEERNAGLKELAAFEKRDAEAASRTAA